jgi:hypothetical protein
MDGKIRTVSNFSSTTRLWLVEEPPKFTQIVIWGLKINHLATLH